MKIYGTAMKQGNDTGHSSKRLWDDAFIWREEKMQYISHKRKAILCSPLLQSPSTAALLTLSTWNLEETGRGGKQGGGGWRGGRHVQVPGAW
jgi:hypothetical protein